MPLNWRPGASGQPEASQFGFFVHLTPASSSTRSGSLGHRKERGRPSGLAPVGGHGQYGPRRERALHGPALRSQAGQSAPASEPAAAWYRRSLSPLECPQICERFGVRPQLRDGAALAVDEQADALGCGRGQVFVNRWLGEGESERRTTLARTRTGRVSYVRRWGDCGVWPDRGGVGFCWSAV